MLNIGKVVNFFVYL